MELGRSNYTRFRGCARFHRATYYRGTSFWAEDEHRDQINKSIQSVLISRADNVRWITRFVLISTLLDTLKSVRIRMYAIHFTLQNATDSHSIHSTDGRQTASRGWLNEST